MFYAFLILLLTAFGGNALAADSTQTAKIAVDQWLVAGPYAVRTPVFADTTGTNSRWLLDAEQLDMAHLRPNEGDELAVYPGQTLRWKRQTSSQFSPSKSLSSYEGVYMAAYISVSYTRKLRIYAETDGWADFTAYFDGKPVEESESKGKLIVIECVLHRGKHLLLIKSVHAPRGDYWKLTASIAWEHTPSDTPIISVSTDPRRTPANFSDITLFDNFSSPTLSPDSKWLAVIHSHRDKNLKSESWLEIYDTKTPKLVRTLRPLKGVDNPFFFPQSDKLGFTTSGDSGSIVWTLNLSSGDINPAIKNIIGLQKLVCAPDGQFLYYTADAEKKTNGSEPSLWTTLENRMSDWTNTRKLYVASLASGATHEITATGEFATDEFALSREGNKLLITRRLTQTGRPYYSTEFWVYDIPSGKAKRLLAALIPWERRPLSLAWLPGGEKVAYTASRFMVQPGDTSQHSFAQCSLWLLDTRTGTVTNLSQNEGFSTSENEDRSTILWNEKEKNLCFQAIVGGKVVLMKTDPLAASPKFTEVALKFPFIPDFDLSSNGKCAFIASDPVTPPALYLSESVSRSPKQITNPAKDVLASLDLATCEKWNFMDSLGYSIDGWLFYPPDFSPQKKWPLVVYYYGGVSPRDERFTFSYHWWAANGYVVYVLNPAGAVGYGEAFANLHSNDWGTFATQDIIEGTRKLVAAKGFIDSTKMAAYGGSYGGFITMDLVTKTNLFAAAVSDAGISDIASYFGGGTWGFSYGDIALPNSFPWNRPDVFAGKSPLYHADKIRTPLLLIHGLSDDNVPPIESAEMFTALKVLGREVAFARFPNEDHSIALKFSDLVDYREMMLAWFDKYLKGESAAWDDVTKKIGNEK